MSASSTKCKNCGCTEIDFDPARGDAVCTNCGSVLADSIIVAEVQFEENARGGSSAIGQFVSSDSKGGGKGFGSSFHTNLGRESREITLQNAKRAITCLANSLRLNQHCIDTSFNFYKMALNRQLTRGRRNTHVIAACVYMTCRTEGTAHMLIDISDVNQVSVYELGRTYLKLSQALCINIPSMDPCLYILRFANQLEFGEKTHEVSMTALRLVQRMKRDSIHSGRRPSGLCGAALLMAARLHEFNRTVGDIIKIVKVHETTLKKRLIEFGETPSSSLTLDEFMTVDLEEEQDPPSFKAARLKDRERLQKIFEVDGVDSNFGELQREIEKHLEEKTNGKKRQRCLPVAAPDVDSDPDSKVAERCIEEINFGTIQNCVPSVVKVAETRGLGPDIASMGLATSLDDRMPKQPQTPQQPSYVEDDLADLDDDEIDSFIMSERESKYKDGLWTKVNAHYLKEQEEKQLKLAKEKEEGKPEKKRKRTNKKQRSLAATSAGEAIEKMLQEKRISTKINYDVLKSLNVTNLGGASDPPAPELDVDLPLVKEDRISPRVKKETVMKMARISRPAPRVTAPRIKMEGDVALKPETKLESDFNDADDFEEEAEPEPEHNELSLSQMLNQHRAEDDYYGGYDYDEY